MATAGYITRDELVEYAAGLPYTIPEDAAGDGLIRRASGDVDTILGSYEILTGGTYAGRKIDRSELVAEQEGALTAAVCAQALYRLEMGEEHFLRPSIASSGPEFTLDQPASHIGPQTWRELSGTGLLRITTTVGHRPHVPPWGDFARNLEAS